MSVFRTLVLSRRALQQFAAVKESSSLAHVVEQLKSTDVHARLDALRAYAMLPLPLCGELPDLFVGAVDALPPGPHANDGIAVLVPFLRRLQPHIVFPYWIGHGPALTAVSFVAARAVNTSSGSDGGAHAVTSLVAASYRASVAGDAEYNSIFHAPLPLPPPEAAAGTINQLPWVQLMLSFSSPSAASHGSSATSTSSPSSPSSSPSAHPSAIAAPISNSPAAHMLEMTTWSSGPTRKISLEAVDAVLLWLLAAPPRHISTVHAVADSFIPSSVKVAAACAPTIRTLAALGRLASALIKYNLVHARAGAFFETFVTRHVVAIVATSAHRYARTALFACGEILHYLTANSGCSEAAATALIRACVAVIRAPISPQAGDTPRQALVRLASVCAHHPQRSTPHPHLGGWWSSPFDDMVLRWCGGSVPLTETPDALAVAGGAPWGRGGEVGRRADGRGGGGAKDRVGVPLGGGWTGGVSVPPPPVLCFDPYTRALSSAVMVGAMSVGVVRRLANPTAWTVDSVAVPSPLVEWGNVTAQEVGVSVGSRLPRCGKEGRPSDEEVVVWGRASADDDEHNPASLSAQPHLSPSGAGTLSDYNQQQPADGIASATVGGRAYGVSPPPTHDADDVADAYAAAAAARGSPGRGFTVSVPPTTLAASRMVQEPIQRVHSGVPSRPPPPPPPLILTPPALAVVSACGVVRDFSRQAAEYVSAVDAHVGVEADLLRSGLRGAVDGGKYVSGGYGGDEDGGADEVGAGGGWGGGGSLQHLSGELRIHPVATVGRWSLLVAKLYAGGWWGAVVAGWMADIKALSSGGPAQPDFARLQPPPGADDGRGGKGRKLPCAQHLSHSSYMGGDGGVRTAAVAASARPFARYCEPFLSDSTPFSPSSPAVASEERTFAPPPPPPSSRHRKARGPTPPSSSSTAPAPPSPHAPPPPSFAPSLCRESETSTHPAGLLLSVCLASTTATALHVYARCAESIARSHAHSVIGAVARDALSAAVALVHIGTTPTARMQLSGLSPSSPRNSAGGVEGASVDSRSEVVCGVLLSPSSAVAALGCATRGRVIDGDVRDSLTASPLSRGLNPFVFGWLPLTPSLVDDAVTIAIVAAECAMRGEAAANAAEYEDESASEGEWDQPTARRGRGEAADDEEGRDGEEHSARPRRVSASLSPNSNAYVSTRVSPLMTFIEQVGLLGISHPRVWNAVAGALSTRQLESASNEKLLGVIKTLVVAASAVARVEVTCAEVQGMNVFCDVVEAGGGGDGAVSDRQSGSPRRTRGARGAGARLGGGVSHDGRGSTPGGGVELGDTWSAASLVFGSGGLLQRALGVYMQRVRSAPPEVVASAASALSDIWTLLARKQDRCSGSLPARGGGRGAKATSSASSTAAAASPTRKDAAPKGKGEEVDLLAEWDDDAGDDPHSTRRLGGENVFSGGEDGRQSFSSRDDLSRRGAKGAVEVGRQCVLSSIFADAVAATNERLGSEFPDAFPVHSFIALSRVNPLLFPLRRLLLAGVRDVAALFRRAPPISFHDTPPHLRNHVAKLLAAPSPHPNCSTSFFVAAVDALRDVGLHLDHASGLAHRFLPIDDGGGGASGGSRAGYVVLPIDRCVTIVGSERETPCEAQYADADGTGYSGGDSSFAGGATHLACSASSDTQCTPWGGARHPPGAVDVSRVACITLCGSAAADVMYLRHMNTPAVVVTPWVGKRVGRAILAGADAVVAHRGRSELGVAV